MKNILTVLLLLLAFTANAGQVGVGGSSNPVEKPGQEGGGGGDSNSKEIRLIRSYFKNNGEIMRNVLTTVFTNVGKFEPVGKISSLMHDLITRGILEDIKRTPYVLKIVCYDENGIERSATTKKVNISNNPNVESSEICINVRKLAMEKATYESIVGLLAHEHSRHFGEDDTDELGLHPLADYITEKYQSLSYKYITEAVSLNGVVPIQDHKYILKILKTQNNQSVSIVIDNLIGECKTFSWSNSYTSEVYVGGRLKKGDRVNLSENIHLALGAPFFHFADSNVCHVTYHIEANNKSSPNFKFTLDTNKPSVSSEYMESYHFYIKLIDFIDYDDLEY